MCLKVRSDALAARNVVYSAVLLRRHTENELVEHIVFVAEMVPLRLTVVQLYCPCQI